MQGVGSREQGVGREELRVGWDIKKSVSRGGETDFYCFAGVSGLTGSYCYSGIFDFWG